MILREEDVGGRERVTKTDEERVARRGCLLIYSGNSMCVVIDGY